MHILVNVVSLAVLEAYIAILKLGVLAHQTSYGIHQHLQKENREEDGEFLLIENARRFCDGSSILEADCENSLEGALAACQDRAECNFLCHTVKKRYPSTSPKVPSIVDPAIAIPKSSASWLCSGQGWMNLYPKNGWITAIKGVVVRDLCKPFIVWLNQTAECMRSNTLDVARDINPHQASVLCKSMPECSFFTMSLQSKDTDMALIPLVHFCKGTPAKIIARDGHFLATLPAIEKTIKTENMKRHSRSRIAYYYGGPLTNDTYYDDKAPGSLVPATRL